MSSKTFWIYACIVWIWRTMSKWDLGVSSYDNQVRIWFTLDTNISQSHNLVQLDITCTSTENMTTIKWIMQRHVPRSILRCSKPDVAENMISLRYCGFHNMRSPNSNSDIDFRTLDGEIHAWQQPSTARPRRKSSSNYLQPAANCNLQQASVHWGTMRQGTPWTPSWPFWTEFVKNVARRLNKICITSVLNDELNVYIANWFDIIIKTKKMYLNGSVLFGRGRSFRAFADASTLRK